MKYRLFTLLGLLALGAGSVIQAQDYDDIYYDAGKTSSTVKAKVEAPAKKTVAVYGEIPENYKVVASSNYRIERDEDEYNRRGAYDPMNAEFEVDINGDTIYEEAFANTHRIERFYNPDIVIMSDDDELVELYYDESPTINLIIGSDWGYTPSYYYSWGIGSYYHPYWYDTWYNPWYVGGWYTSWYRPYYYGSYWYGPRLWNWPYYSYYTGYHGWDPYWSWRGTGYWTGYHGGYRNYGWRDRSGRVTTGPNRNGHGHSGGRNGITARGNGGGKSTPRGGRVGGGRHGVTASTTDNGGNVGPRGGAGGTRTGGNIGTRVERGSSGRTTGVTTRQSSTGVRHSSGSSSSGSRVYGGSSSSRSSGSRSSGSYSGGSRSSSSSGGSRSSGSYSGGSRSSGGSYSGGGSRGGGGGGSHGSSGGGRRR